MLAGLICGFDALLRDRKGFATLEYGMLAATVVGAASALVAAVGADVNALFERIIDALVNGHV